MSYVNKALATPDLTESTAKNVVIVATSFVPPNILNILVHDHNQEHMMLVTRLKCAGGLADLMTRK